MIEISLLSTLLKLSLASIFGIVIGLDRELKGKPLGLKTCLIVSVAACLLTVVSYESAFIYSKEYSRPMDPGRLPSYVISGIGFLGAGVILRRSNESISGLTTASLVLASAGIGIAIGAGFYLEAIMGVAFIFIGIRIIPYLFGKLGPKKLTEKEIRVRLYLEKSTELTKLMKQIKGKELGIKRLKLKEEKNDIVLSSIVTTNKKIYTTDVYYVLKSLPGVIQVEVENLE
ncbi:MULTISPECIES: MgtC/SapB family protein [Bacillus]|uniref:Methyltransferase n=2 Tax=Bacillus TaxID=1386 RepID=A0A0M4GD26_9BACI|nr:MgtC/SapB family protein [Bacillus capparidis]ALC83920.1 methyltransferase [Bacillus gobiensis]MBP1083016.1 putative Mg2+ transporter-C (MgtC) family protein [Bacillus capparidis]